MRTEVQMSLKMSLDEIIEEGLDYERKVIENLAIFGTIFGRKIFKAIFLHKNLDTKQINSFVERNEKALFHINSKITATDCNVWFAIEKNESDNKRISYRYRYPGNILSGLVKFFEVAKHLKDKEKE